MTQGTTDSSEPTLSVVVITMNRADDLAKCLDNLLDQDDADCEIIVVDNNSTDHTREMVRERYPSVRLLPLAENRGVSGGRNAGIESARGEICVCIDDDAVFRDRTALRQTREYFERDDRLACLGYTIRDSRTLKEEMKSIPRRDKQPVNEDYEASYFCGAGFAVRRQPFLDAGLFWDPLVYGSQEIDLSYRYLEQGWRILHTASVDVIHKSSPQARPSGQWVYFNTRDRPWVAVRHLPWLAVLTTTFMWWGHTGYVACRGGELIRYLHGIRDAFLGLGRALRTRRRLPPATLDRLHSLSGRYWY